MTMKKTFIFKRCEKCVGKRTLCESCKHNKHAITYMKKIMGKHLRSNPRYIVNLISKNNEWTRVVLPFKPEKGDRLVTHNKSGLPTSVQVEAVNYDMETDTFQVNFLGYK